MLRILGKASCSVYLNIVDGTAQMCFFQTVHITQDMYMFKNSLSEQLVDNSGIGALMSGLIRGDGTSDLTKHLVAIVLSMSCSCTVRDLSCTLLEGSVDETQVWVVLSLRVHARPNQVLDGDFDSLHVHSAREHAVLVHEVTVSVLLCCPLTSPSAKRQTRLSTKLPIKQGCLSKWQQIQCHDPDLLTSLVHLQCHNAAKSATQHCTKH